MKRSAKWSAVPWRRCSVRVFLTKYGTACPPPRPASPELEAPTKRARTYLDSDAVEGKSIPRIRPLWLWWPLLSHTAGRRVISPAKTPSPTNRHIRRPPPTEEKNNDADRRLLPVPACCSPRGPAPLFGAALRRCCAGCQPAAGRRGPHRGCHSFGRIPHPPRAPSPAGRPTHCPGLSYLLCVDS